MGASLMLAIIISILCVCAPSSITITSPLTLVNSSITLTCNIFLTAVLESEVFVDVTWISDGSQIKHGISSRLSGNGILYISQLIVKNAYYKFGTTYTCTARLKTSLPSVLHSSSVCTSYKLILPAPLHPSPPSIFYSNTLSTSITLLWTQPDGDIVDNYTIFTSYFIRQCNGSFDLGKKIVIDGIDGTLKMYTLTNLEADTDYNITIVAHNEAGSSKESMTKITKTNVEAPSSSPRLMVTTVTSSSISIAWNPLPCRDRNGDISRYVVLYCITSDRCCCSNVIIVPADMKTDGVLNITNLIPKTNYSIRIRADHTNVSSGMILLGPLSDIVFAETHSMQVGINRGEYPVTLHDCSDVLSRNKITADVFQLIQYEFGVNVLGKVKAYPASSCDEVNQLYNGNIGSPLFWISSKKCESDKKCCSN